MATFTGRSQSMTQIYNTFRRFVFALLLIPILFFLQVPSPAHAIEPSSASPTPNLFSYVTETDLTDKQASQLAVYRSARTTVEIRLIQVQTDLLERGDAVNLNLLHNQNVALDRVGVEKRTPHDYSWFGNSSRTQNEAILVVEGNDIDGTIQAGTQLYSIRPLGNGLQALIQVDQSAFPPDEPPEFERIQRQFDRQVDLQQLREGIDASNLRDDGSIITVLVAYTPAAKSQANDIDALIQLAVDQTNESYANSQIKPRLSLVHKYETNYTEDGDMMMGMLIDLKRFERDDDGFMDEVHSLRDKYAADVAVLIRSPGDFCGWATLMANANTAFALVAQNCMVDNHTFAHEIGHLQGAEHNPEADGLNRIFAHGHGYCYLDDYWRTIMSIRPKEGCQSRLKYWSNPNVTYNGLPMGTTATHDNHRVLNETAYTVANFRPSPQRAHFVSPALNTGEAP
jgi:peptidyl-Asp metalloendopeptidase